MGFYIRKSIRLGPVRFNLSKSGVGTSIGVKGFRIGSGPRGNYIHAGRNGFYYRASIPSRPVRETVAPPSVTQTPPPIPSGTHDPLKEIESGDVLQMMDASSAGLLEELNHKRKRIRFWPLMAGVTVTVAILCKDSVLVPWILVAGALATLGVYYYDQLRKTVVLFYDFEPEREAMFKALHDAFQGMIGCNSAWHVDAEGAVRDRKYHAGASSVVRRNNIQLSVGQPPFVKTNIDVPTVPAGKQTLYFFPDRLLVFEKSAVGAVGYGDLKIDIAPSKFVEDGSVPRDAEVVDRTWRYVNKKGGPDKRFKDNRELPIALYEESHFQSGSGLNEIISLSKRGTTVAFSEAIAKLVA